MSHRTGRPLFYLCRDVRGVEVATDTCARSYIPTFSSFLALGVTVD